MTTIPGGVWCLIIRSKTLTDNPENSCSGKINIENKRPGISTGD
jgi:hypothetical protein